MTHRVAIMQPYLFPYLGYLQLIAAVDQFVLHDDVQYIYQGWVNRNRILIAGKVEFITFPIRKAAHTLHINQRTLAANARSERLKILRRIIAAYAKAPYFNDCFPVIEAAIESPEANLAAYARNGIQRVCDYLRIATPIIDSSSLQIGADLVAQERVIAIVHRLHGDVYINPIGGLDLYQSQEFHTRGIKLLFHKMDDIRYPQFGAHFEPALSIIDVMMFNDVEAIRNKLSCYSLQA